MPGWTATAAAAVNEVLDTWLARHPDLTSKATKWLGADDAPGFEPDLTHQLRAELCLTLGGTYSGPAEGLSADLVRALINHAQDPDICLPDWLQGNTPVGIEREIPAYGIFPPPGPGKPDDGNYAAHNDATPFTNYTSFVDNSALAGNELARERHAVTCSSPHVGREKAREAPFIQYGSHCQCEKRHRQDPTHP